MERSDLIAGARTVVTIDGYFTHLKGHLAQMQARFGVAQRGYFTPNEDEEARTALLAYWRARAALLDLVLTLHPQAQAVGGNSTGAFIIAYAGALLLVDAARHLREQLRDQPAALAKLNEPEPVYGIPAGAYDQIQKSLTDPENAFHLYRADRFFDHNRIRLASAASINADLIACLQIIHRLRHRVQVPINDYLVARLEYRAASTLDSLKHAAVDDVLYFLQATASKAVSEITLDPSHRPTLPDHVRCQLRQMLQPGDVLITRKEYALTNYFLPGFWPHAGLYIGSPADLQSLQLHQQPHITSRWPRVLEPQAPPISDQEPGRIVEALKDGVQIRSALSMFHVDAIAILRPTLPPGQIAQAISRALFHEGKQYDFDFDFTRSDRMVCSEVIYRAYDGIAGITFDLTRRVGRLTLAPEDLLQLALQRRHFLLQAAYVPGAGSQLHEADAANHVVASTLRNG